MSKKIMEPIKTLQCLTCRGRGQVEDGWVQSGRHHYTQIFKQCPVCKGSGQIEVPEIKY